MRLEQLRELVEIACCNSLNQAARNMNISRQALTSSLQTLETELNCQILVRSKTGVHLTKDGEKVLVAAQDIIARMDTLRAELSNTNGSADRVRGKINLCVSPMINASILPLAFTDFSSRYPGVSVFTCDSYRQDIIDQISKDSNTCGILLVSKLVTEFFDSIPDNVELAELKTYPIYIAVSPRHPLANQRSISVKSLAQYPIIVYEVGGTGGVHALSKLIDIDVALSTNNAALAANLLNKDHAVMYSFEPYIRYNVFPDFLHIPIRDKETTFTTYVAFNKKACPQMRKLMALFVDVFIKYL